MLVGVVINPGTEPGENCSAVDAEEVALALADAVGLNSWNVARADDEDLAGGWYAFYFWHRDKSVLVHVPGDAPLDTLRGRAFFSRRLYVDGSSWLFPFAVSALTEHLSE